MSVLARVLASADLAERIAELDAPALARIIEKVGLEDAGELVALASTEQLAGVFDEDLWKNERAGQEERFDADRFGLWLEVMLEAGDAFVANRLADLDEDFVAHAFALQILVVDLDELAAEMTPEADKALESSLSDEIDHYQVIARRPESWDAVLTVLVALDRDHHDVLERILDRCARASSAAIEADGLHSVLSAAEELASDVAAEREDRRTEQGHVEPRAAAAFLELARRSSGAFERDALTKAHLREASRAPVTIPKRPSRLENLLGTVKKPPLLGKSSPLAGALAALDPETLAERSEELAYLVNVVVAGQGWRGRRLRPIEAVRIVMRACELSLERGLDLRTSADLLFRRAWATDANTILKSVLDP